MSDRTLVLDAHRVTPTDGTKLPLVCYDADSAAISTIEGSLATYRTYYYY